MNIYIGKLARKTTEDGLRKKFEAFGKVISCQIIKDKFTGESRGFAFVEMPNKEEAMNAIKELNGKELDGSSIIVSEARPRRESEGFKGRRTPPYRKGGRE